MRSNIIHSVALAICLAVPEGMADWPEFRGPHRDGSVNGIALPTSWSQTQNIVWRTELPGEGWSSPVVVGNSIYLTAAISSAESEDAVLDLALLILDARTGIVRKRVDLFKQSLDSVRIHEKNSHASPTPVIDQSKVYVHFGPQGTACVTLAGEIVWKNDALTYNPVHGNGGSPVVVDGLVIFSRDGADISEVTALDANTGALVWSTPRNVAVKKTFSFCTPTVIQVERRRQLILPGSNVVQSVDPATGDELWRVTYDGYSVVPQPIQESGLLFVCTGYDQAGLLAIDPTGRGDVTETHVRWRTDSNIPKTPSPVGFDGRVAMISDRGIVSCFAAENGDLLWRDRVSGNFSASPLLADKLLYVVSEQGVCTVLDVSDQPKTVATNVLGEDSLASPAVVEDDLLIRTSTALYRIGNQAVE